MIHQSHKIARTVRLIALGLTLTFFGGLLQDRSTSEAASGNGATRTAGRLARAFMVHFEAGRSVCRAATAAEASSMADRSQNASLHMITAEGSKPVLRTTAVQPAGLNIILRGTPQLDNFPQAKAAFLKAAANWQALFQTPITIVLDVDFGPTAFGQAFPANVLGETDSENIPNPSGFSSLRSALISGASNTNETALYSSLPASRIPTNFGSTSFTWGTAATLRALGLMNPVANPDGEPSNAWGLPPAVAFNSNFQFDFDPSDGIDANKLDFDAIATHEIGHALGFTSNVGDFEQFPVPVWLSVWDLFRFRPGTTVGTFPTASRILSAGGTQDYFFGGSDVGLSTGRSDGSGGDGEQASHWKGSEFTGIYIGIMDPTIDFGQRQLITNNDMTALNSFGYRLKTESPAPYPPTPLVATTNLASGVAQNGSTAATPDPNICLTSPTQYKIQVPVGATQLSITLSGSQDVDLHARSGLPFVSAGGWPGLADYTSNSPNGSESIVITPSNYLPLQPGVYFIAVDNCGTVSATFSVTATVTAPNNTSAIDDPGYFVTQHYFDFLNRNPDLGGLSFWTSTITNCGADANCIRQARINVSDAFFFEQEYQQTGAYVYRLYREAYGNTQPFPNQIPDPQHPGEEQKLVSYSIFAADRAQVVGGSSLTQSQFDLANAFVLRPEFLSRYPAGLDGPGFVDAVLATIKNDIGADLISQRAALITLFNQGGRGNVIYRLADDNLSTNPINNRAFIDAEYNRAFVATQYFGYLRHDPDMPGFLFWLGQVNSGPLRDTGKQHAMVCSFITSDEYQFRFGTSRSHTNAECQ